MIRFLADASLHHAIVSGCSRREPAIDFPGVFLVKQRTPLADVIDALVLVWAASDSDEWKNRILEIPLR